MRKGMEKGFQKRKLSDTKIRGIFFEIKRLHFKRFEMKPLGDFKI